MRLLSLAALSAITCASCAAAPSLDPQAPSPVASSTPPIVVCPDGSNYDPTRNVCIATASIAADPTPKAPPNAEPSNDSGSVSVSCGFRNGWVSLVPVDDYPDDDSMLMQGLIGLTEEPNFWTTNTDFASMSDFAAKRCSAQPVRFTLPAGDYFVVVGEADTFQQRGAYQKNGMRRRITLRAGAPLSLQVRNTDLTHTWFCISCPFVSFIDPQGHLLPPFVVLANRRSSSLRGTDRVLVRHVPVRNGRIQLRIAEAERETTHLDQLGLELNGRMLLPDNSSASALAFVDNVHVELTQGKQVVVSFLVNDIPDGFADVTVVASGFYEPIPY